MSGKILTVLKTCLTHPSFMYFFILPVYVPLRSLSDLLLIYKADFPNELDRLLYFADMVLIMSIVSAILFIFMRVSNKFFGEHKDSQESLYSFQIISLCSTFGLIITSSIMLNTRHLLLLYLIMPVHFMLIKYIANYVIIAGKRYKTSLSEDKVMNSKISNNIIKININMLAILATAMFVFLASNQNVLLGFVVAIEIVGFLYILFYADGILALKFYFKNHSQIKKIIVKLLMFTISIFFSLCVGFMLYISSVLVAVLVLVISVVFYVTLLKLKIKKEHLKINIVAGLGYGIILFTIMSSVIMFCLSSQEEITLYKFSYLFEPLISLVVTIIFLMKIFKNKIDQSDYSLMNYVKRSNYLLIPYMFSMIGIIYLGSFDFIFFIIIFVSYSYIEYNASFSVTQVIYKSDYSDELSSMYNLFYSLLREGVIPSVFILAVFVLEKIIFIGTLKSTIVVTMVLIAFIFMILTQRFIVIKNDT